MGALIDLLVGGLISVSHRAFVVFVFAAAAIAVGLVVVWLI